MITFTFSPEKLKKIRERKKLTTRQVADRMGRKPWQYISWERGDKTPGADKLAEIATALEVHPGLFFKDDI